MELGDLGRQVVVKGKNAYRQTVQAGDKLIISSSEYAKYNAQYLEREARASERLQEVRDIPGIMLNEIIAKGAL